MTLPDFLLARYAEDEADAMAGWRWKSLPAGEYERLQARVLADVEAKRRIVAKAQRANAAMDTGINPASAAASFALTEVLQDLALPYADHEDFQEEWAL